MNRSIAAIALGGSAALFLAAVAIGQDGPSAGSAAAPAATQAARPLQPVVEVEQEVYSYKPANNGAGPMWCFGNSCIVRVGEQVFASGIPTLADHVPLNNVRWTLFRNVGGSWSQAADGGDSHEREPCPVICFNDGRVLLSTNPNSCKPDKYDGPAAPQVLEFRGDALTAAATTPAAPASAPAAGPRALVPKWSRDLAFHGHTYRSFAADGVKGEMVLFYNLAYDKTYWAFCDSRGQWSAQGEIDFPWGKEYDKPQPVRVCYPTVQLKDRAVYFCGVSDVVEPYQAWRDYKKQLTGQEWDYDIRRLFFTWSDDIATGKFHP